MKPVPDQLLELQTQFDQRRATGRYDREPMPAELREAVLSKLLASRKIHFVSGIEL